MSMWKGRRTRILALLVAASLLIPLEALLLPDLLDRRALCVRADSWIQEHPGSLPQLYDDITSFPMAYRKRIFAALTPAARAGLWHVQLSRYLAKEGGSLTKDQAAFVRRCLAILTPELDTAGVELAGLREEMLRLYPRVEDRKVFFRLGEDRPSYASWEGVRLQLAEALRSHIYVSAQDIRDCVCTAIPEYLGYFPECFLARTVCMGPPPYPYGCNRTGSGCGFFWHYPCEGLCCDVTGGGCAGF